jgi:hypothetical protein
MSEICERLEEIKSNEIEMDDYLALLRIYKQPICDLNDNSPGKNKRKTTISPSFIAGAPPRGSMIN